MVCREGGGKQPRRRRNVLFRKETRHQNSMIADLISQRILPREEAQTEGVLYEPDYLPSYRSV